MIPRPSLVMICLLILLSAQFHPLETASKTLLKAGETRLSSQDKAAGIEFEQKEHAISFTIDGEDFTTFHFSPEQNKPYFHPVYAAGKTLVVRQEIFGADEQQGNDLKTNLGHFHHKGIWIAIDSVNDAKLNYWHEKHVIKTVDCQVKKLGSHCELEVTNHWLDEQNQPLFQELTRYTLTPERLIVCQLQLTALEQPVTFYDTKEGLFAIRVEKNLREVATGKITNAEGLQTEAECWGKPSPWVDYTGEVDGKTAGVTLLDHPQNFRPGRYHARAYGLFSINPFGPKSYSKGTEAEQPFTLQPGKSVVLRYGLFIHAGPLDRAEIARQQEKFFALQ